MDNVHENRPPFWLRSLLRRVPPAQQHMLRLLGKLAGRQKITV